MAIKVPTEDAFDSAIVQAVNKGVTALDVRRWDGDRIAKKSFDHIKEHRGTIIKYHNIIGSAAWIAWVVMMTMAFFLPLEGAQPLLIGFFGTFAILLVKDFAKTSVLNSFIASTIVHFYTEHKKAQS